MIQRLALFIENQNISTRAFEQKISASDGMIRRAINKNTDIQSKWMTIIADKFPHINIEWLITGRGSMLHNTEEIPKDAVKEVVVYQSDPKDAEIIAGKDALIEAQKQTIDRDGLLIRTLEQKIKDLERSKLKDMGVQSVHSAGGSSSTTQPYQPHK